MLRSLVFLWGLLSLALGVRDKKGWPYASFQTGPWEPPHLLLRTIGEVDPGKIFISVRNNNLQDGTAPTIFDGNGDMVWQGEHRKTMDFKMQKLYGQDVITYWDGETGVIGYGYGKVHILDHTYKEIYTVTLEDNFNTPNGHARESYIDVHEHYITPNNTMLVSAINISQTDLSDIHGGKPDMWVIEPHFYEIDIKTNKVLFKWKALDHVPLTKSKIGLMGGKAPSTPWDGYHMNSVTSTKDGYLISLRHFCSAFYLEKNGTVRWQLSGRNDNTGDFKSDKFHFSFQHDARVHNETDKSLVLTVLNNNALSKDGRGPSTGVALNVDLVNMEVSTMYNLADPADRVVTGTQGSFQFLNYPKTGHMILGYGSVSKFKEFDGDGHTVLRGEFGEHGFQSYRVFKFPWRATPHWNPKVVVKHPTHYTTDVYMSWNGATDYDNWAIYSVPSENSTLKDATLLSKHERHGFETHVALENTNAQFIMAVARQNHTALGKSPIVKFAS